jgi:hypothetical protein
MSGAIPPLPQYDFMAWCSVKAQVKGSVCETLFQLQRFAIPSGWNFGGRGESIRRGFNVSILLPKLVMSDRGNIAP